MKAVLDKNILVISDLHLGEDLRPGGTNVSYLRHLVKLERELENFLAHYTEHRLDGREWRLVVNGDMVDFMSVKILPDGSENFEKENAVQVAEDDGAEDRLYGLGFGERSSQRKLEKVIVRHQGVFGKLAAFVKAGNDLVIVVGNHDAEFQYEGVQRTLVEWLCGLAVGAGAPEEARAQFAKRIQFCPWFYYREDLIYIEHGHQYDEYCSFDYLLCPSGGGAETNQALSMAHAGMRYFANQLPEYDPHTAEHWGVLNYFRWAWAQGMRGAVRLSYFYGLFVWRAMGLWHWLLDAQNNSERRAKHDERLRALSIEWQISKEKLQALDALRSVPVLKHFWKVIAALFIDRVILATLALGLAIGFGLGLSGLAQIFAPIAVLGVAVGVNESLNRMRLTSPASKLRLAPQMIQRLMRAPFIVFGHSHAPESVALGNGSTYFNTGTWASPAEPGPTAEVEEASVFTHLLITASADPEGEPHAELRQWRDGVSAPFRVN